MRSKKRRANPSQLSTTIRQLLLTGIVAAPVGSTLAASHVMGPGDLVGPLIKCCTRRSIPSIGANLPHMTRSIVLIYKRLHSAGVYGGMALAGDCVRAWLASGLSACMVHIQYGLEVAVDYRDGVIHHDLDPQPYPAHPGYASPQHEISHNVYYVKSRTECSASACSSCCWASLLLPRVFPRRSTSTARIRLRARRPSARRPGGT